jgi:hypothetical protein
MYMYTYIYIYCVCVCVCVRARKKHTQMPVTYEIAQLVQWLSYGLEVRDSGPDVRETFSFPLPLQSGQGIFLS